jgi:uncharacterized repeat protein (TIGR03803 family)
MRSPTQHLGTRLRAVSIALGLAIVLLSALAAVPSAPAQTYRVLYNFTNGADGSWPFYGSLVEDKAGNFYGTTEFGGGDDSGVVFKVVPSTRTVTPLWTFTGGADGGLPTSTLFLWGNMLYGTTLFGGSDQWGVVFELNIKTGVEKVLYNFTGGADGGCAWGGPVLNSGVLYGATGCGGSYGGGVVYKVVVKTGRETVLHSFGGSDGAESFSSLALDKTREVLYGTAYYGGSSGYGVVFRQDIKTSTYKVLYNFTGPPDGESPFGALALDPDGNLYGTTSWGGTGDCFSYGCGVVFKLVPKTGAETVLYSFTGGADGAFPFGSVIRSKEGKLYGTTECGGFTACPQGYGTVFEVTEGSATVLHTFNYSDGANPFSGVIMDSKRDLYGTTYGGGSGTECGGGCGVVWEMKP